MSTYSFHVLYQHSTPQVVTTLVVLLSASACIFLLFNRKANQHPAILVADDQVVVSESSSTNLSKETAAPEVQPPSTPSTPALPSSSLKKSKPTKGDKKGDKGKKRQGKQDGPSAPKVRTLAHRRPARRLEDSPAAAITEDQQEEQQHAPQSLATQPSSKPPEDGTSTGSQNSPPRSASPSPSEATTATTAVTIQSSTLILTPPPTVIPGLVALPVEHEKDARVPPSPPRSSDDAAAVRLDDADDGEEASGANTDQIEHEGWIRVDNETPTIERREPLSPLLVPPPTIPIDITTPTSLQNDSESPKSSSPTTASTSNIPPPPDDGETVVPSPTPSQQPPPIITPATPDKPEPPAIIPPRPSPSSQPRALTPSEYPRSPRTRQGSSGGVGLGIPGTTTPASGSQSRVGVSRSSPSSSPLRSTGHLPLPPRHRRHQPGQPPQQVVPPPLLQPIPPYAHYGGGRPTTPGSGLRSPLSPPGVPFVGGAPGWMPGPAYSPVGQQPPPPQAFLRPYPPPGYMHPGPHGPHGGAAPPPGLMPYIYYPENMNNSHGRSRSVSDISPYQGGAVVGVAGMTSIVPNPASASQDRTAATRSGTQGVKGKTGEGKEDEENEEDFVVEFPTLNPTPGKPSQSSEPENLGEGASSTVSEAQPVEQQQQPPTGWMSPGFAPYPPEMLGYPPWSPQAAAYFQPRPYPHHSQMPGASTPSSSSTSSSPAWTHLGLPPSSAAAVPRPNPVPTPAEAGAASGAPEEDLRRQTLANSIAGKSGTSTPSAPASATSSPRIPLNHLHPQGAPSAMPPYAQPHSPMAPTSGPVPLMPNPHLMRQGPPPSPGPMAASWHGSGGYFMPGPVPPPHPQWIGAQNSPRSGTPSGEPPVGPAFLASPRSRSSSPFVGGRATPPVQAMYPGYFGPPPPMNYPYGPVPPLPMQQHSPSPSYVNGRRSSVNSSPLQSRSRKNITNESPLGAGGAEDGGDDGDQDRLAGITDVLVESTFEDPEGFKAASTSNDRSSRGTLEAASESGGGESEKEDVFGSTSIEEEPPSARTA